MTETLSPKTARRIALSAQGFGRTSPAAPGRKHVRDLVGRLGVVQIDSVNVVTRTHYLPAFSRLGDYPREALEAEAWGTRRGLFEYWGHEASLLPMDLQPLLRWRMARAEAGEMWTGLARFGRERRDYIDGVLTEIERRGPVTGADFNDAPRGAPGWWSWSDGKRALEWLFWAGMITTKTRRGFERVYDLTERALPSRIVDLPTPAEADAQRELVRIAAQALGVATQADLRDYFRLPLAEAKARVAELVEAGELTPATVKGWRHPAYLAAAARTPRKVAGAALLSPFDNLIWTRDRTERLFGTRVRLEIYTPAHKRTHGYYVLPFLEDEAITARVDLKSDRQTGVLRVQAAWREPDATAETAERLAAALKRMAGWLGLEGVEVVGKGDLADALAKAFSVRGSEG
ncbi:MAG: winged helix-turn-helix domain-containing protein [Alphaproteobacteria bacterium]|nr:winged helix-turn-helix domain-containing protein [Alphaproteobacteria bacterium]MBU2270634.1 winged helix-turn-helix domain-containing protein [Alphaproteobacteria bacterium]MBU2418662.1 winged helix-turn-helix domain-containing protein [Alphaproteobacteria bacterium]